MDQPLRWIIFGIGVVVFALVFIPQLRHNKDRRHSDNPAAQDDKFADAFDDLDFDPDYGGDAPEELYQPSIISLSEAPGLSDAPPAEPASEHLVMESNLTYGGQPDDQASDWQDNDYRRDDHASEAYASEYYDGDGDNDSDHDEDRHRDSEFDDDSVLPSLRIAQGDLPLGGQAHSQEGVDEVSKHPHYGSAYLPDTAPRDAPRDAEDIDEPLDDDLFDAPPLRAATPDLFDDLADTADQSAPTASAPAPSDQHADSSSSGGFTSRLLSGLGKLAPGGDPDTDALPQAETGFIFYVVARDGGQIEGERLNFAFADLSLQFDGEYFSYERDGFTAFTVTNLIAPGSFGSPDLRGMETMGVACVLSLPCGLPELEVFDLYVDKVQRLAESLDARVLDQTRSSLTQQTIKHYRDQVTQRARQARLDSARQK